MRLSHIFVTTFTLAACVGDGTAREPTVVARHFEELASALASCAQALRDCSGDDAGPEEADSCRQEFLECRERAGTAAQNELARAIGECQDQAQTCRGEDSASGKECADTLRDCIGDARADAKAMTEDAAGPNPNAPTYQCFGQLRECVAAPGDARECAAEVRACVNAAMGEPPVRRRPNSLPPQAAGGKDRDAGMAEAGTGGSAGGEADGGAGVGGSLAGTGGGGAGTGGAAGGAGTPADAGACELEHAACLAAGERPMTCDRELRKCERDAR